MATKITKSELKQMIREALREELAQNNYLAESSAMTDQAKRLKRAVQLQLINDGLEAAAYHLNKYDFEISDTIKPGTVEVNGNTIIIHSGFLAKNMYYKLAVAIAKAIKSNGNSANNGKIVYVLTTFRGKDIIYEDFYEAVTDAEGDLAMEANMIDTMYQAPDGTLTEVPESDPNYHRWTEEEGIKT
jgi:hypothetical protein